MRIWILLSKIWLKKLDIMKNKIKNWFCKLRKHPYQHKPLDYYRIGNGVCEKMKCSNCGCVFIVKSGGNEDIRIFQKNVGEFYIGNVIREDSSYYYCENFFSISSKQVNSQVGLVMMSDDVILQTPPVFFRAFLPELKNVLIRVKKNDMMRITYANKALVEDYKKWISRVEKVASNQSAKKQ